VRAVKQYYAQQVAEFPNPLTSSSDSERIDLFCDVRLADGSSCYGEGCIVGIGGSRDGERRGYACPNNGCLQRGTRRFGCTRTPSLALGVNTVRLEDLGTYLNGDVTGRLVGKPVARRHGTIYAWGACRITNFNHSKSVRYWNVRDTHQHLR
jgi:hypothetical protein